MDLPSFEEFTEVDCIVAHIGKPSNRSKMLFKVRYRGKGPELDSWLPFHDVMELEALDSYISQHPRLTTLNSPPPTPLPHAFRPATRSTTTALASTAIATTDVPPDPNAPVPLSITQALLSTEKDHWMLATAKELASIKDMHVWQTPSIPIQDIPRKQIIPSKLIFARMFNADGTFRKYKTRLCARGDRWADAFGVSTYAGTVKTESIKILLSIVAEEDYELCCVDVETAFLHSDLPPDKTIYMRRPAGLSDADMPEVVKLDKCIYGLPHASQLFRKHSDKTLRQLGFQPTASDPCVYSQPCAGGRIYALVHVDDIALAAPTSDILDRVKTQLGAFYKLKQTDMTNYLGMHVIRDRSKRTITLMQTGYIESLKDKYSVALNTDATLPPSTPMEMPQRHHNTKSLLLSKLGIAEYQGFVGSLLYLAAQTRPDILYSVCAHARKSKAPTEADMEGVIRILKYVVGTPHLGVRLHSGEGIVLYATVDASYACHTDLKSHSGVTLHIGKSSGAVHSFSKKQTVTADSSTMAELIAAHLAAHEIMWARNFLFELGYPQKLPTPLYEDNKSTITIIANEANGQRSKHIDLRYNFVREQAAAKVLQLIHLPGIDMTSDILTKPLGQTPYLHLRPRLLGM
jgi:hypothetical protein